MERSLDLRRGRSPGQGRPDGCDRFASFVGLLVLGGQAALVCYGFAVATGTVSRPQWPPSGPAPMSAPLVITTETRPAAPPARAVAASVPSAPRVTAVAAPVPFPMAVPVSCADIRPVARELQRRFGRGVTVVSEGAAEKSTEVGCGGYSVRTGRRAREVARFLGSKTQVQVRKDADGIFHVTPSRARQASASIPGLEP